MSKILLSIPDDLANQFKVMVPARQRSQFLTRLLANALKKQEQTLYESAKLVEEDTQLNQDIALWDSTLEDGLDDTSWHSTN